MDDTLGGLVRIRELGIVQPRVTDQIIDELRSGVTHSVRMVLMTHAGIVHEPTDDSRDTGDAGSLPPGGIA